MVLVAISIPLTETAVKDTGAVKTGESVMLMYKSGFG